MCRRGQAMVETVLAVLVITALFLGLFGLSRLLPGKIMLEHAAMRAARARAVGLNRFQCLKAARVAVIPSAGERLHPGRDDTRTDVSEAALARMYMRTPDSSYADGLLRYEGWNSLSVDTAHGGDLTETRMRVTGLEVRGEAVVDDFPVYLNDGGL